MVLLIVGLKVYFYTRSWSAQTSSIYDLKSATFHLLYREGQLSETREAVDHEDWFATASHAFQVAIGARSLASKKKLKCSNLDNVARLS